MFDDDEDNTLLNRDGDFRMIDDVDFSPDVLVLLQLIPSDTV